ncbi:heparinase II/III family protein [Rhodocytophaga aerolata]|uniref:Heparinase II/III family protein n=1 Tax=Rhodocytophaga aerolata TaxID=455078 RepID=A0ABT8QYN4_9BACT|nr:heparinase II/III family protein [Rhodocytophaga aerolata]MDO1444947.1 heparinase II/III family protein [Rhodocytophaga aerolata]
MYLFTTENNSNPLQATAAWLYHLHYFTRLMLLILTLVTGTGNGAFTQTFEGKPLASHPRILLLKGEEETIRKTIASDPAWEKLHQTLIAQCDRFIKEEPIQRIQIGRRLLDKSRELLRRVFYLAYAYRVSGEEKYMKRAEKEMLAVAGFSDWNPSHFLDVAEMTLGMAIGYDWLYQDLPQSSREIIKEAILKKGIEPSLDTRYSSWLKASHNWNQVCNAGMAYGALAIYEDEPQLAERIIKRSLESIQRPLQDYLPDGAYPEGYSYWAYGTSFQVLFISAIEKALGNTSGMPENAGFLKTAGYLQHMTGPSGECFNYSDSGLEGKLQPAMFWFAQKVKDPSLLWVERQRLATQEATLPTDNRLLPAVLLWGAGTQLKDIRPPKQQVWVGQGKNPVALMRTSWTDPAAIYVGLKAGSPAVNHGHMDVGSFVMEAQGVRWAMDFGMQSYESLESKGVRLWDGGQHSQRWQIFRYSNFTHNTLTVNDSLQRVNGYAAITTHGTQPSFLFATTDITALYADQLTKAQRGVAIVEQQYVLVQDEIETANDSCTIRWTMLTPAAVQKIEANKAYLVKDGKKLTIHVQKPAGVRLKTWRTYPPNSYDAPNPGTVIIGFEVKMPQKAKETLEVLLIPEGADTYVRKSENSLINWARK